MNSNQKYMLLKQNLETLMERKLTKKEFKKFFYQFRTDEMPVTTKVDYCIENLLEFYMDCSIYINESK